MPSIAVIKNSKFLGKSDVTPPILATIASSSQENVAMEHDTPEMKWALNFKEGHKPLILNTTNAQLIAGFLGSEEMNDWIGRKIVIFYDPSVSFGGRMTGGLRVRAPKKDAPAKPAGMAAAAAAAAPTSEPPLPDESEGFDDKDAPF